MDIMSAILVLAPLLAPMAAHFGINPVHFGIIMIVNLEIGYLTPPVGINLFVASTIFKVSIGQVIKAVYPIIFVFLTCLGIITAVPELTLFAVKDSGVKQKPAITAPVKADEASKLTDEQQVYVGKWTSKAGQIDINDDSTAMVSPPLGKKGGKYLPKMDEATVEITETTLILKSAETSKELKIDMAPRLAKGKTIMKLGGTVYTKEE